jgi:hypothetical protein
MAVSDYYFLLQRKYPQKKILRLVADRHKLNRTERSVLYRGIACKNESHYRKLKLLKESPIESNLNVDGLNQILTVASYLKGSMVYISTDDILRDAAENRGKNLSSKILDKSIDIILEFCDFLKLKKVLFYIDKQANICEKVEDIFKTRLLGREISSKVILTEQVDKELKLLNTGLIATSDSQIIDRTSLKIFDLACQTLTFHFNPDFIDLNSLLTIKS